MKNRRILSMILAIVMVITVFPATVFAVDDHDNMVRVIIENSTYSVEDGAPWDGVLVDDWEEIDSTSTMMSCVVAALDNNGYEQSGAENNYISTINGLSEFDGGGMSGWMGTLNDWFTNYGFGDFSVAAGNFGAGDEIHIMYTCAYGDDLGGSWGNTDTRINSIRFSAGALNKDFGPDSDAYTLTLPAGTTEVNVLPTAANKNYMVRIFLNDFEEGAKTHYGEYEYKRNDLIPVKNGDTIYVGCGLAQWPSMNESDGGHTYAFNVVIPEAEQKADYKTILNNTLAQLAVTVDNPTFGTGGGEWSVLSLARGGYFATDDPYFETYYSNVEKTVPGLEEKALASGKASGALDKNKSTENSRLILALTAIGKNPTNVGGVNVLGAYDANGFGWIKKQGINGPIFALIALDANNYKTTDTTLRQQCVDFILDKELANGGWALSGNAADPDITSMALQALAKYKNNSDVKAAAKRAFTVLSNMQKENGGFASWGSVNSESIAQVIVACTAWGIDPNTDSRFVKNGNSAVDALLDFYVASGKGFAHVLTSGGGYTGGEVNGMATDQACYALVAYDRFVNEQNSLYDMTDVKSAKTAEKELSVTLSLPAEISNKKGTEFNAIVSISDWNKEAGYKLADCIVSVPDNLTVTSVTMGNRVSGGKVMYNLDDNGKLRIVYFDAEKNADIQVSGTSFPAEFFIIGFKLTDDINVKTQSEIEVSIDEMTLKKSSDESDDSAVTIVNSKEAKASADVVKGISFSAKCLYVGDGIDLIPTEKMAIAVFATELDPESKLSFNDDEITLYYSKAITEKTGVTAYVAMVPADTDLEIFADKSNYSYDEDEKQENLDFGDTNNDGVINAQDSLNAANTWLRKSDAPDDEGILRTNVTSDGRINTSDALGIVENFVNGDDFGVVVKAAA